MDYILDGCFNIDGDYSRGDIYKISNIFSASVCQRQCQNDTRTSKWVYVTNKYKDDKWAKKYDCFCKNANHEPMTNNPGVVSGNMDCKSE